MSNVSSSNSHKEHAPKLRFGNFLDKWTKCKIEDIACVVGGGTPDTAKENYWGGNIQWFTPTEVGHTKYVTNSVRTITEEGLRQSSAKMLAAGSVLLSSRATIGECSIALQQCTTNQGFQSLIPKDISTNEFLYYLALSLKTYFLKHASGSTFLEISNFEVRNTPCVVPCQNEQQKIAGFLSLIDKRIDKQFHLISLLKSYKRGAIARYFSEQIIDNENWANTTISNCLFYEQPQKYIVHSEHYSDEYKTPVLTANKAFILGYTNETDGIYDKGEVLIYDDFTMEVKYVNFPFKVKSSTIKMLTPKRNIDLYFMFNLLQYLELKPEGHQRSYISILEPMEIKIPCYEEQRQAAKLFRLLDSKIEREQHILQSVTRLKAALLQQLFI